MSLFEKECHDRRIKTSLDLTSPACRRLIALHSQHVHVFEYKLVYTEILELSPVKHASITLREMIRSVVSLCIDLKKYLLKYFEALCLRTTLFEAFPDIQIASMLLFFLKLLDL